MGDSSRVMVKVKGADFATLRQAMQAIGGVTR
jgi:hypothetical protein